MIKKIAAIPHPAKNLEVLESKYPDERSVRTILAISHEGFSLHFIKKARR